MQMLRMAFLGVAAFYLQALAAPHLAVWGAAPNILLAWAMLMAVKLPRGQALVLAFLLGLAYDLTAPLSLGLYCFMLTVLAEAVHRWHNHWSKNNPLNIFLSVGVLTIGWNFSFAVFHVFAGHGMPVGFLQLIVGVLWQAVASTGALYFLILLDRLRFHVEL